MRTRPRSTRCPCGTMLVEGRCPPCDAIDEQARRVQAAKMRRHEEARLAVRMGTRERRAR